MKWSGYEVKRKERRVKWKDMRTKILGKGGKGRRVGKEDNGQGKVKG